MYKYFKFNQMDHETYGTKVNEELENKPIYLFSFASNYKNRVWRNEVLMRKQERGIEERIASGFCQPLLAAWTGSKTMFSIYRNISPTRQ